MDDGPIAGRAADGVIVNEFLARYDVPAYVRRALAMEQGYQALVSHCRQQRDDRLKLVRTRLGRLYALSGDRLALLPGLRDPSQLDTLRWLHATLAPQLRMPVGPTTSLRRLRRALVELVESIDHFNRRWPAFLHEVDLAPVNALREGYNRYYLLEKECAVRSARLARQGFHRLPPLTADDLAVLFPPLPIPALAE